MNENHATAIQEALLDMHRLSKIKNGGEPPNKIESPLVLRELIELLQDAMAELGGDAPVALCSVNSPLTSRVLIDSEVADVITYKDDVVLFF